MDESVLQQDLLKDIFETRKVFRDFKDEYKIVSGKINDLERRKRETLENDDDEEYAFLECELTVLYSQLEVVEIQVHTTSVQLKELMKKKSALERRDLYKGYTIIHKIGKGSYGNVYLAMKDNIKFVLKTIAATIDDSIPHEVVMMRHLQHVDGVPKLYDYYVYGKYCVIVMDYLPDSVDLLKWFLMQTGNVDDKVMDIFKKLVLILIEIDKSGFVHRDIKLENVIVDKHLSVRVIDFDHCIEKDKEPFTKFNGTISYYPPEWFQNGKCLSEPMTVWSLGVLLYKLLTGCNPFPSVHKFDPGFQRVIGYKSLMENLFQNDPDERIALVDILKML